jgi:hypothetical protein
LKPSHLILASLASGLLISCSQISGSSPIGLTQSLRAADTPGAPIGGKAGKGSKKKARHTTASYFYHGCGVYSSTDLFFRDVTSVGVDANSATIIAQLPNQTGTFDTDDQGDEQVNLGTTSTTTYTVQSLPPSQGGHTPPMYGSPTPPAP